MVGLPYLAYEKLTLDEIMVEFVFFYHMITDDLHDRYVVVLIVFLWCPILAKGAGEGYRES